MQERFPEGETKDFSLKPVPPYLGGAVRGREIPAEELKINRQFVERLVKAAGGMGDWVRKFYSKYLPKVK